MSVAERSQHLESFLHKAEPGTLAVALGYVGLPFGQRLTEQWVSMAGCEIDESKIRKHANSDGYVDHLPPSINQKIIETKRFIAGLGFSHVSSADTIRIYVPVRVDQTKRPDLTAVRMTAESIADYVRPEQFILLGRHNISRQYNGGTQRHAREVQALGRSGAICGSFSEAPKPHQPGHHSC